MLRMGQGVEKDLPKALGMLEAAAARKHPEALRMLGEMHREGLGVPKDLGRAFALFAEAETLGDRDALFFRGYMTIQGEGTEKDVGAGVAFVRSAAEAGHARARFLMGQIRLGGIGVPADGIDGMRWFARAVLSGDAEAASTLNDRANGNDAFAAAYVALLFLRGPEGVRNPAQAERLFPILRGHGAASAVLGIEYARGEFVDEDPDLALAWLSRKRETAIPEADYQEGRLLLERGGPAAEACEFVNRAARAGHAGAQTWMKAAVANGVPAALRLDAEAVLDTGNIIEGTKRLVAAGLAGDAAAAVRVLRPGGPRFPRNDPRLLEVAATGDADSLELCWEICRDSGEFAEALRYARLLRRRDGDPLPLARHHLLGEGIPRDLATAARLFAEALERDSKEDPLAQLRAADPWLDEELDAGKDPAWAVASIVPCCLRGRRLEADEARLLLDMGRERFPPALALAFAFSERPETIEPLVAEAAAKGDPDCQWTHSIPLRAKGQTKPADEWLRKASDGGLAAAQIERAAILKGEGKGREAAALLEQAAAQGAPEAWLELGTLLDEGRSVPRDVKKAREWIERAAEAGEPRAATALAGMLLPTDPAKAAAWLQSAAEEREPGAISMLAALAERGENPVFRFRLGLSVHEGARSDEIRKAGLADVVAAARAGCAEAWKWLLENAVPEKIDVLSALAELVEGSDARPESKRLLFHRIFVGTIRSHLPARALARLYAEGCGFPADPVLAAVWGGSAEGGPAPTSPESAELLRRRIEDYRWFR
jgi:hypothetical protein